MGEWNNGGRVKVEGTDHEVGKIKAYNIDAGVGIADQRRAISIIG